MSGKIEKILRKQAKSLGINKQDLRRVRRLKKVYNLTLTQTLFLMDKYESFLRSEDGKATYR